eukprot:10273444-Ditylum_brightwellii.AAC.1
MLKGAVLNARAPKVSRCAHAEAFPLIPLTTLHSALTRLGGKEVTKANVFPKKKNALLGDKEIQWLQDVIRQRDINNEGMTCTEVVKVIAE